MKTVQMTIQVTFDEYKTDSESIASALDRLMETATSTQGVLDECWKVSVGEICPPQVGEQEDDADLDFPLEEYTSLQAKYVGRGFIFRSPFEHTPGWADGDRGVLVRLIRKGTEGVGEVNDLWVGYNLKTGDLRQLFGGEAFTSDGCPVVVEQRFLNWSPGDRGPTQHEETDEK